MMELKDALYESMLHFRDEKVLKKFDRNHGHNDKLNPARNNTITYLVMKILKRQNFKDFSLIDFGCGNGQDLEEMGKIFSDASLYGVDAFPIQRSIPETIRVDRFKSDSFEFYKLDFMHLLKLDFKCDIAMNLGLYHAPDGMHLVDMETAIQVMKDFEKRISSRFKYFITRLGYNILLDTPNQYDIVKNGIMYYSGIPIEIIDIEEEYPIAKDDSKFNKIILIKFL